MITGIVNAELQATIPIVIVDAAGKDQEIEAIVDTGFDGWVSLPLWQITAMGLAWSRRAEALLADGSRTPFDIYEATIIWDNQPIIIPVDAADIAPTVGMALLHGYEIRIRVTDGGAVAIETSP